VLHEADELGVLRYKTRISARGGDDGRVAFLAICSYDEAQKQRRGVLVEAADELAHVARDGLLWTALLWTALFVEVVSGGTAGGSYCVTAVGSYKGSTRSYILGL